MAQQHLDFGTAAANDGEYIGTAFPKIQANFEELYGVQDLTADTNSSAVKTANTAAIQAAIDAAYAAETQVVTLPPGVYYCDPGIYLDAPSNLRSSLTTPTIFAFSLHLKGAGGLGNHEGHGTQLRFTDNSTNALIVGTGQGMMVSGLSILGPSGATSRAALSSGGAGILVAGGSGGSTRTLIENVMVENFRHGVRQGANNNALGDAVTLRKCNVANCYRGHSIEGTQNYINSHEDCVLTDNTTHVYSPVGKPVNIRGGNYSTTATDSAAFTIGSTSTLSSFTDSHAGSNFTNWTFTTTLAADDQPMIDGAYDAFAIVTTGFGVIPLVLTNYNSGTRVATLKFYVGWLTAHYKSVNVKDDTDITAELQGATLLYAAEMVTPFFGTGINVDGAHVECPSVLTRLISTETTFTGDPAARLSNVFINHAINHTSLASGTNAQKAVFYTQQAFPFLRLAHGDVVTSDCAFSTNGVDVGGDGINVEVIGNTQTRRLISRNCDLYHPNVTVPLYGIVGTEALQPNMTKGAGEWDATPFIASIDTSQFYVPPRLNSVPFRGWRPEPSATPRITPTQLADIEDGLGAVGSYPPLHGGTAYLVLEDTDSGPTATQFFRSAHVAFSYGQNLSINWSYKGQTNIVTLASLTRMFAGLRIGLDNGGGVAYYTVTGVYPTLGYVTVSGVLAGTKTTTYNGATVEQQTYSISRSGNLPASKFTTDESAGAATAAAGTLTGADFVNVKITAIGAANYSTRTAAQMFGDITGCYVGYHYMLSIQNTNAGTTTLNPGNNVTINGTATVAQNTARLFHVTFPTATTCTINSLGVTATL